MARISLNDRLFVTLTMRGRIMAQASLSGIDSFKTVMAHLRNAVPGANGIGTVNVRNSSQGWTTSQTVFLR